MKSSNIGGQAVLEGIMMRHEDVYSVAVRKPDGEIEVKTEPYKSIIKSPLLKKTPIVRGVFNFIESLVVGMKCLTYSASFYEDEEEETVTLTREEQEKADVKREKQDKLLMYGTVAFSIVLSVAIFIMLPYFIAGFLRSITSSEPIIAIAEAVVRIIIFLGYIMLISRMKDIQRVFMYHGAEHKCINCVEHGMDLTVENVMSSSREHKRCGTSFLLFVMVVSIIFFLFIRVSSPWLRVVVRLLLVPVIAGVSYEIIRLAGRSDNKIVNLLSKPGMALQRLTTREPEADMVEVAIAAVEAVFDWRTYLTANFSDEAFREGQPE
ncbi:DUF1385 domain-containing protein [Ruminococcus sp. OA3]|uniref:DUF1385 domain-containing protein n=1 Tax=Ruminococcus sp. OA3 TaxID=2914164 RepID=UPI001F0561B4|nr:DUF1385 domain-containing protein [Ruminococcus sp. OA3]MCH1984532.1 DUF1385 domain-containing protein [Ruminococcus sp. OA3]